MERNPKIAWQRNHAKIDLVEADLCFRVVTHNDVVVTEAEEKSSSVGMPIENAELW